MNTAKRIFLAQPIFSTRGSTTIKIQGNSVLTQRRMVLTLKIPVPTIPCMNHFVSLSDTLIESPVQLTPVSEYINLAG